MLKRFLAIGSILFLLSGCGGFSHVGYYQNRFVLQAGQNQLALDGQLLRERRDNFTSLFLKQDIIRLKEGGVVVYEDVRTDLDYEFEPMITRIVKIVFEANRIIPVYGGNHLFAYQILFSNGKMLNVIAQQSTTQHLKLLYGMSTPELNKILKALDPSARGAYYSKQVIQLTDPEHAIMSKWDVKKIHFVPLVVPLSRFMGRM
jgi:hypothetical protein